MADQGRWFKLWCCANTDQVLSNLDVGDFGRWCKLGAYIKENGVNGILKMPMPARLLVHMLQVKDVTELVHKINNSLPNLSAEVVTQNGDGDVTFLSVTYKNWRRWQADQSKFRMRTLRAKKRDDISSSSYSSSKDINNDALFSKFWKLYPKKTGKKAAYAEWKKLKKAEQESAVAAIEHYGWPADPQFIPDPERWIKKGKWEDEQTTNLAATECDTCHNLAWFNEKNKKLPCPKCGGDF